MMDPVTDEKQRTVPPFADLLYEVSDLVCTITLNRPHRKNALSGNLVNELIVALETAGADPSVGAIILTGAGGVFCSGGDLSQMSGGGGEASGVPFRGGFPELNIAFTQIGKPVIAKVRRYALAGGLGVVTACQFALAEDSATFGTPEIDRGLFPMMIMANIFRTVPRRRGLELILTGDRISASAAVEMGLINRAVPSGELDTACLDLAQKLAAKSPVAMRLGLEAFYAQDDMAFAEALPYLGGKLMETLSSDDAREGLLAFMEKRQPKWSGR
jgi:enoyl-CoA hydratase/carnithine racemase